jgi:small-conductance mechanosensitive channel
MIPGFVFPDYMPQVWRMDFGPEFEAARIITNEPPLLGRLYEVLVPQVDSSGNDLAGIRIPEVAAPLGTHMGWNVTVPQLKDLHYLSGLVGSFIPFPKTRQEREASGDSRLSIEERYKTREDYLKQVRQAGNLLVRERFMLADDLPAALERARQTWDFLHQN